MSNNVHLINHECICMREILNDILPIDESKLPYNLATMSYQSDYNTDGYLLLKYSLEYTLEIA